MPQRPIRPCAISSCPGRAAHGKYCATHASYKQLSRQPDTRPSAAARGYDAKWRYIRAQFLKAHSQCVVCGEQATEVDHVVPLADGGTHQWSNLQAMCKTHHSQKTALVDGGFGKARGGGNQKSGAFP